MFRHLSIFAPLIVTWVLCIPICGNSQAIVEEKIYAQSQKHWLLEIPLWIPGIRGQLAYGDIDLTPSDGEDDKLFKQLFHKTSVEFYLVGRAMYKTPKIICQLDAFSGALGRTYEYVPADGGMEKELVYLTTQVFFPRLFAGYNVLDIGDQEDFNLDVYPYLGTRYMDVILHSDVFGQGQVIDLKPRWIEVLFGLYIPIEYKRWKLELQADYGISGKNYSWVYSNALRYRASQLIDFQIGWSLMNVRLRKSIDHEELKLKMNLFGPTAGIGFWL